MSMIKIIDPAGWNFDRSIAQLIKVSSRGLIGNDRIEFLKTASHEFLDAIDNIKVAKDEEPVHLIALGASEIWGPNRNGDGFSAPMLRRCHDSFVKHAKWYRNHCNKDPRQSYGYVEKSAFNEPMQRVELLTMLNRTKEAAERNNGFVADRELEKLARGEDLAVSMAIRVPHDTCSSCGHTARTRANYCTQDNCVGPLGEKRGGCLHNLTKVSADGHVLHVDNPDGVFFDISDVFRPADNTAYGFQADYLQKAASHAFIPGAELAELLGITAPSSVIQAQTDYHGWPEFIRAQIKLASGLAELEQMSMDQNYLNCFDSRLQPPVNQDDLNLLGRPGSEKAAEALAVLADSTIFLSFGDFARWLGRTAVVEKAATFLPQVYTDLLNLDDWEQRIERNPFTPAETKTAGAVVRDLARNLRDNYSVSREPAHRRTLRAGLRGYADVPRRRAEPMHKQATDSTEARQLAIDYGLYKLAGLARIARFDSDFSLTVRLAMAQNSV